jgi:uncharacterized protein YceK
MKGCRFRKILYPIAAAAVLGGSGCASVFVRSKNTVEPDHVFPATAFDGQFFWSAGVKGEPLLATADVREKNKPMVRLAYGAGALIDLPFSVAFDTLLLPVDLIRSGTPKTNENTKGQP